MTRSRAGLWRWCGLTLATLLLLVAAARPVLEPDEHGPSRVADREAPNVFVVLDRSPDMRVRDYPDGESRMAVAREDVATLLDRYPGARVAVLSFATRPPAGVATVGGHAGACDRSPTPSSRTRPDPTTSPRPMPARRETCCAIS